MPKRTTAPRGKSVPERRINVGERRTSIRLEDPFWTALNEIAAAQETPLSQFIATIDNERRKGHHSNLSSAIRLFVLEYYRSS